MDQFIGLRLLIVKLPNFRCHHLALIGHIPEVGGEVYLDRVGAARGALSETPIAIAERFVEFLRTYYLPSRTCRHVVVL